LLEVGKAARAPDSEVAAWRRKLLAAAVRVKRSEVGRSELLTSGLLLEVFLERVRK
jgi:hypothetical protein